MHRITDKQKSRCAITLEITDDNERACIQVTLFNSTVSTVLNQQFQLVAFNGGKKT
jgi:hypothetical protein